MLSEFYGQRTLAHSIIVNLIHFLWILLMFSIRAPRSKPETQRALLCSALANGYSKIITPNTSPEVKTMCDALRTFGVHIEFSDSILIINGLDRLRGHPRDEIYLNCAGSALVARTLMAIAPHSEKIVHLNGDASLWGRPFKFLFEALVCAGRHITPNKDGNGYLIAGGSGSGYNYITPPMITSQFASALCFQSPLCDSSSTITVQKPSASSSYLTQTLHAISHACQQTILQNENDTELNIVIKPMEYKEADWNIGIDFTDISYHLLRSMVRGEPLQICEYIDKTMQGERSIIQFLEYWGGFLDTSAGDNTAIFKPTGSTHSNYIEIDLRDAPNILPTLSVLAAITPGITCFTGMDVTQFHKSNRPLQIAGEIEKLGARVSLMHDPLKLVIEGSTHLPAAVCIEHGNDHRVALSFLALRDLLNVQFYSPIPASTPTDLLDVLGSSLRFPIGAS